MNKEKKMPEMVGVFSELAYSFIDYKRSLGYKYDAEPKCISRFCRFAEEKGVNTVEITKELAYEWCAPREYESRKSRSHRITCIRQFAIYISNLAYPAYIMPEQKFTNSCKGFTPYIFTDDEIHRLIKAVDQTEETRVARNMHLSLPVIFRLLYCCGMRVSEVCTLKVRDVDLVNGVLTLKNTKNGMDRYIPLSGSVHKACLEYSQKVSLSNPDDYFFKAPDNGQISPMCIYERYRRYLLDAKISHGGKGKGPRLHDLRHTFAVHALQKWIENDENIYAKLPILSAYMGHSNIHSTSRYLRLTAAAYPDLLKTIEEYSGFVIPEGWDSETD